jgi:hypothetical protein
LQIVDCIEPHPGDGSASALALVAKRFLLTAPTKISMFAAVGRGESSTFSAVAVKVTISPGGGPCQLGEL